MGHTLRDEKRIADLNNAKWHIKEIDVSSIDVFEGRDNYVGFCPIGRTLFKRGYRNYKVGLSEIVLDGVTYECDWRLNRWISQLEEVDDDRSFTVVFDSECKTASYKHR